ncbi:putative ribonuclease H-like domain-containing protein [Tanacetum coccineum]
MAFMSSTNNNTSSTNEAVNTVNGVSTASTQVNIDYSTNIDNLSDVVICSFFASQPNSPQLIHEDLQQIYPDDSRDRFEMENGHSKVECYNCHKKGHFAKEYKALRNQDYKNKESTRRTVLVETSTSRALVSCDGLEVSNNLNCSKSCLKTVETLKSQYDQLHKDFKKYELMFLAYKSGLESVEEKLEVYKANESIYSQDINVLKFEIECKDITIKELRKKLEIAQKEKDGIQFNVDKFENASKSLNKLIKSQIVDNCKKGLGYNAVPPPYTRNFMPPTPDLSFTGLDVFSNKSVVENSAAKSSKEEIKVCKKCDDAPIIEEWVSDNEEEDVTQPKIEKKTVKPSNPQMDLQDKGVIDSGCSRHMTGNMSYLTKYEEIDGGYVAFGGNPKGGKITGKCTIKTARTPQQNGVAERSNRKLIEAARTMLADSKSQSNGFCRTKENDKADPKSSQDDGSNNLQVKMKRSIELPDDPNMHTLEDISIFDLSIDNEDVGQIQGQSYKITPDLSRFANQKYGFGYVGGALPAVPFSITHRTGYCISFQEEIAKTEFEDDQGSQVPYVSDLHPFPSRSSYCINVVGEKTSIELPHDPNMPALEDYIIIRDDEDVGAEADMNNLDTTIQVSPIPTTRIHKDHPLDQVIGDLQSATQTGKMSKNLEEHGFVSTIQQRTNHKDLQNCLFACFLSHEELKKTLVDLPNGKRAIGTKWVFRNKKDKRGIVIRNKAILVAQGNIQKEGIDYDKVFASVLRIEAIRLFLAYVSFKDFVVYQMDVKSAFLYGKIKQEVYVCQPPGFEDLDFPDRVYKVKKALYGLHQDPRAWYETLSAYLLDNEFQRRNIDKTLFIKRYKGDILLVQVYVDDIIFGLTKKELCNAFEKSMHEKY